jgi:hypothetical protein
MSDDGTNLVILREALQRAAMRRDVGGRLVPEAAEGAEENDR